MDKRVSEILRILGREFPKPKPFLTHRSAFEFLMAIILSAQCTDERVNRITPTLFPKDKAATPEYILKLGTEKVRQIIHPTGYYNSKTKSIMALAKTLHKGEPRGTAGAQAKASAIAGTKNTEIVPKEFEKLIKLPGVGPKSAQVLQAQWYGIPAFPVDTHVHRVANRLGLADSGVNRDKTERQLKALIPQKFWISFHMQLVLHGRKTCTARSPKCGFCPVFKQCVWPQKQKFAKLKSSSY